LPEGVCANRKSKNIKLFFAYGRVPRFFRSLCFRRTKNVLCVFEEAAKKVVECQPNFFVTTSIRQVHKFAFSISFSIFAVKFVENILKVNT